MLDSSIICYYYNTRASLLNLHHSSERQDLLSSSVLGLCGPVLLFLGYSARQQKPSHIGLDWTHLACISDLWHLYELLYLLCISYSLWMDGSNCKFNVLGFDKGCDLTGAVELFTWTYGEILWRLKWKWEECMIHDLYAKFQKAKLPPSKGTGTTKLSPVKSNMRWLGLVSASSTE